MTFNQLNYFITVARNLSFSRAAELLFVTQSTLSRSIASMESELGVTLFDRVYHNLKLTPAGELMLRDGVKIMDSLNSLIGRMQSMEESKKKRLTIGILDGQKVETRVLLAVKQILEDIPEFGIDIRRMDYETAIQGVSESKLDVVQTLMSADTVLEDSVDQILIEDESYYLVASNDDPIWQEWNQSSLSVLDKKVLLMSHAYPGNDDLLKKLSDAGILSRVKVVPDMETLSLWLEAGMGVSICNASHVTCSSGVKRSVRAECLDTLPKAPVALLWNKNNLSSLLELFLSYM